MYHWEGGCGGGGKSTMVIRNLNLWRSHGRKRGKIRLIQPLICMYPFPPLTHQYSLYVPLQLSSQKKILGGKNIAQHLPPPPPSYTCAHHVQYRSVYFFHLGSSRFLQKHSYPLTNLHGVIYNQAITWTLEHYMSLKSWTIKLCCKIWGSQ